MLEDTDVTPAELRTRFGPNIARLVEALTQDTAIVNYGERKAALRRRILDADPEAAIVSLADKAAKLQSAEHRPKDRRIAHYQATLDGIEARYGRSRLSERLRVQRKPWPEMNASALERRRQRNEHGRQLSLDAEPIEPRAPAIHWHQATSACRERLMSKSE